MQTITITDEELHELIECLEYRVTAYRHSNPPPTDEGIAWINHYEERNKELIQKLNGKLSTPECDPYHLKQVASWNKRLDELLEQNKANNIKIMQLESRREELKDEVNSLKKQLLSKNS